MEEDGTFNSTEIKMNKREPKREVVRRVAKSLQTSKGSNISNKEGSLGYY